MKHLRSFLILIVLICVSVSVVFAGSIAGYQYYINGFEYRVGGYSSWYGSNSYVYQKTTRTLPFGSPDINFQKLNLRGRLWLTTCPAYLYDDTPGSQGDCTNCKETLVKSLVPPLNTSPTFDWVAVGKHKLVDSRATNYYGQTPDAFYTAEGSVTPSSKTKWKGDVSVCSAEPIIPFGFEDDDD